MFIPAFTDNNAAALAEDTALLLLGNVEVEDKRESFILSLLFVIILSEVPDFDAEDGL